jgi:hypothetical protein
MPSNKHRETWRFTGGGAGLSPAKRHFRDSDPIFVGVGVGVGVGEDRRRLRALSHRIRRKEGQQQKSAGDDDDRRPEEQPNQVSHLV